MPRRQWSLFQLGAGGAEWVAGLVMCSGAYPVLDGAGLASFGAEFCALLAHVFVKHAPGSCGCISWLETTGTTADALTWRAMARSRIAAGQCAAISGRYTPGRTEGRYEVSRNQQSKGTTGGRLRAHQNGAPWPYRYYRLLGHGDVRAGHDRVRQPEPAGHGIVPDIVRGVPRRDANVAGFAHRYANVAGFACRRPKAAVSRRRLCHA